MALSADEQREKFIENYIKAQERWTGHKLSPDEILFDAPLILSTYTHPNGDVSTITVDAPAKTIIFSVTSQGKVTELWAEESETLQLLGAEWLTLGKESIQNIHKSEYALFFGETGR